MGEYMFVCFHFFNSYAYFSDLFLPPTINLISQPSSRSAPPPPPPPLTLPRFSSSRNERGSAEKGRAKTRRQNQMHFNTFWLLRHYFSPSGFEAGLGRFLNILQPPQCLYLQFHLFTDHWRNICSNTCPKSKKWCFAIYHLIFNGQIQFSFKHRRTFTDELLLMTSKTTSSLPGNILEFKGVNTKSFKQTGAVRL